MPGGYDLTEYSRVRLHGRPVPDDLRILLRMERDRVVDEEAYADPLEEMDVALLLPGHTHWAFDHSHLTGVDRADVDTMANVAAMDAVCAHIGFVARLVEDNDDLIGYWLHAHEPVGPAPLVKLDSEGQFTVLPGASLAEALLIEHYEANDDVDDYKRLRRWFADHGITVTSYKKAMKLDEPKPAVDPDKLRDELYEAELARRSDGAS